MKAASIILLTLISHLFCSISMAQDTYPNGQIKKSGDQVNGKYFEYYEDGKVKMSGTYANGMLTGEWISYNADGKIILVRNFKNNELDGFYEQRWATNPENIYQTGYMKNDQAIGEWKYYDQTEGWLNTKINVVNDSIEEVEIYNKEGFLIEKGFSSYGQKFGEWKVYDDKGVFVRSEVFELEAADNEEYSDETVTPGFTPITSAELDTELFSLTLSLVDPRLNESSNFDCIGVWSEKTGYIFFIDNQHISFNDDQISFANEGTYVYLTLQNSGYIINLSWDESMREGVYNTAHIKLIADNQTYFDGSVYLTGF